MQLFHAAAGVFKQGFLTKYLHACSNLSLDRQYLLCKITTNSGGIHHHVGKLTIQGCDLILNRLVLVRISVHVHSLNAGSLSLVNLCLLCLNAGLNKSDLFLESADSRLNVCLRLLQGACRALDLTVAATLVRFKGVLGCLHLRRGERLTASGANTARKGFIVHLVPTFAASGNFLVKVRQSVLLDRKRGFIGFQRSLIPRKFTIQVTCARITHCLSGAEDRVVTFQLRQFDLCLADLHALALCGGVMLNGNHFGFQSVLLAGQRDDLCACSRKINGLHVCNGFLTFADTRGDLGLICCESALLGGKLLFVVLHGQLSHALDQRQETRVRRHDVRIIGNRSHLKENRASVLP